MKFKEVGRKRTQLLDYLRNRRYWELKEKVEDKKWWKQQFIIEYREEIEVIFHKFMDVLTSSINSKDDNNNNNNNNNNNSDNKTVGLGVRVSDYRS